MEVPWGGRKGRPSTQPGSWGTGRGKELQFEMTDLYGGSAAEARGSFAALVARRGYQRSEVGMAFSSTCSSQEAAAFCWAHRGEEGDGLWGSCASKTPSASPCCWCQDHHRAKTLISET